VKEMSADRTNSYSTLSVVG